MGSDTGDLSRRARAVELLQRSGLSKADANRAATVCELIFTARDLEVVRVEVQAETPVERKRRMNRERQQKWRDRQAKAAREKTIRALRGLAE